MTLFFFLSGFCSLLYQVVWLRVAMAAFGVTTQIISIVLSVFMAGLALGSWAAGRVRCSNPMRWYAATEFVIGVGGILVVPLLHLSPLVLLPFCVCMGATFPLAIAASQSFSRLYLANVLGAMTGALVSAFVLIEWMGFRRTALVAAAVNAIVAFFAWRKPGDSYHVSRFSPEACDRNALWLLFLSGLSSLGMEVVWTRQFVPFLGPVVYSFAVMLTVYLLATAMGSRIYRIGNRKADPRRLAIYAACCALLPLIAADPRISTQHRLLVGAVRVLAGIGAFCGVLGFLTPMLVDRWSAGDAARAGRAYAVNAIGCILGPLIAGFVLLPTVGERWTLVILAVPFFAFASRRWLVPALAVSAAVVATTRGFETMYPGAVVRRDHTATVIAAGTGMDKKLLVNGMGITSLTPITKMMVHFPLASLDQPPRSVLVICFGMGTSFRSALSWGAQVTGVDLVPSVPRLFGYFHADAARLLSSPQATIVVNDGRRFLQHATDLYDAIVIDPPPPVEAAGSSMLYSAEFYEAAKCRLAPGGILQQWVPWEAERVVRAAVARALAVSFPYVRAMASVEGTGLHFLAGERPIPHLSAVELTARVPADAARDLLEWGPESTVEAQFARMLKTERAIADVVASAPGAPVLTDDRAVNEYYFLRRTFRKR